MTDTHNQSLSISGFRRCWCCCACTGGCRVLLVRCSQILCKPANSLGSLLQHSLWLHQGKAHVAHTPRPKAPATRDCYACCCNQLLAKLQVIDTQEVWEFGPDVHACAAHTQRG